MFTGRKQKFMERWRLLRNSLFVLVGLAIVFGSGLTVRADSYLDGGTYRPYEGAKYALKYGKYVDDEGEYYIKITGVVKPQEELEDWGRLVISEEIDGVPVTSIADSAFYGCSGLTGELVLPSGLTSIGHHAFDDCSGLTGELVLPSGLTSIGEYAFRGCSGLTGVKLPSGLTSIGEWAFARCSGLTGELKLPSGLKSIEENAFGGCSGLTGELVLPNGLKRIESCAFEGCSGLTGNLTIPKSVASWGSSAFDGCSFENVTIEASEIPEYAFAEWHGKFEAEGCKFTGKLTLEETVTSIGRFAFYGCSVQNVVIPKSVTSIGTGAFQQCNIYGYKGSEAENYVKRSENSWYACTFIPLDNGWPVYEIQFNGNGATGGSMDALTKCEVGKSYTLPTNKFTRTGYTFAGWNTKKNGTGKSYKNGAQVKNLTDKNGKAVVLYAQWIKKK